jgi:DnaJ-class molecular chaperone
VRASPLPETGAIEAINPQQAGALRKFAQGLNAMDYFLTLGLTQAASPGEIKKAFYRESRTYHPDRFFHLADSQEKTDINSIYKRVTEAYYVLRDDAKRKKYLADLAGADRNAKLRYTEATESELKAEARKSVEEEFGTSPKARPFFKTAAGEFEKGNWQAAISALKMGLTYEPGNARFKEMLAEANKKLEDARRGQAPNFMIK